MTKGSCIFLFLLISLVTSGQDNPHIKDFLLGKFDYKTDPDFEKVNKMYAVKTIYLNATVYSAFKEMHAAAKTEGVELTILSGTRNFYEQKVIWERKWKKLDSLNPSEKALSILEFSSMPGTSRHHWGTDVDLNNFENSYFEEGRGKAEYEWLVKNAGKYGFYQVYNSGASGRRGYNEEKWHWSYLPLAAKYLEEYNAHIGYSEITGFEGSELAGDAGMIDNYVNGIPQELRYPPLLVENYKKLVLEESSLEE